MPDKPTISDVARHSGVSIATVSLVLNRKPGISQETRARVLDAANDLGYPFKNTLTSAANRQLRTIGLIVRSESGIPPQANAFYSQVIVGIEEVCRQSGIALFFGTMPVNKENYPEQIPSLIYSDILDGLLMAGAFVDETILSLPGRAIPPLVLVDGYSNTDRYDAVVSDNYQATYDAVGYLICKGHRHIALIGGEEFAYPSLSQRRKGYTDALQVNNIAVSYRVSFNINYEKGYDQTRLLLQNNPQITALFAINDEIAVVAMRAAQSLGKKIPDDLSIIGYDDTYLSANTLPALTAMHVDMVTMGRAAVHLLQLRVASPDIARMTLTIHPVLVERSSVAGPAEH